MQAQRTSRRHWSPLALAGLAALTALGTPLAAPPQGKRYAVLVGVKEYHHGKLKDLDYPEADVEELAKVLERAGYEVVLLTGAEGRRDDGRRPTLANIRRH